MQSQVEQQLELRRRPVWFIDGARCHPDPDGDRPGH
jgi:hypothetical protein